MGTALAAVGQVVAAGDRVANASALVQPGCPGALVAVQVFRGTNGSAGVAAAILNAGTAPCTIVPQTLVPASCVNVWNQSAPLARPTHAWPPTRYQPAPPRLTLPPLSLVTLLECNTIF